MDGWRHGLNGGMDGCRGGGMNLEAWMGRDGWMGVGVG